MTSFGLGVIGMRRFPEPEVSETTDGGVSKAYESLTEVT
jgi:hypothetical protein